MIDLSQVEVRNPKYNWLDTIDCEINHPEYGWIPFTATPEDPMLYGQAIYAKAVTGDYGPIAPFVPPANIVGESAMELVRQKRNDLLQTKIDPLVMNSLRWADLSDEEKSLVSAYRQDLLNVPEDNPNAIYVFSKEMGNYVEQNVTWPQAPDFMD